MTRKVFHSYMLIVLLAILVAGCGKTYNNDLPSEEQFVVYSVKTWKSIDISADAIYSALGDMYREGHITEVQKDKLITIGDAIHVALDSSKKTIIAYMWADQLNDGVDNTQDQVINSLVVLAQAFYSLRDEAQDAYKLATGNTLVIPDIFMFDALTSALIRESK